MKSESRIDRRRLTIAALILLVVGGGLWWSTRPKIDPRFVGSWRGSGSMTITPDGYMASFSGSFETLGGGMQGFGAGFSEDGPLCLRFRTQGNDFEVVWEAPPASIWDALKRVVERKLWSTQESIAFRGTIVDITDDSFTLAVDEFGTCKYQRGETEETR